jgi:hypothetical protein
MTEPRRDRWGRYLLPDPVTGEERAWTRATTLANTLSDPWGLVDWKLRMAVKGVATRDDLRALAAALPLDTGKKQLNEVAQDAIEYAGGSSGRNMGTALHEWTAQWDRDEAPEVPPPWDRDLMAYDAALGRHGIKVWPDAVEQIVCLPDLGVAGTLDRIVHWPPEGYIADVKTGADLSYSWLEIAVQLALYANAPWIWNERAEEWEAKGAVNTTQGLVMHLPVGQARCDLFWVDLEIGWEAVTLAVDVREWRKRKDISRPFGVDLLGRSPVQPVLDLAGEGNGAPAAHDSSRDKHSSPAETSPAAAGATESDAPAETVARGGHRESGGEAAKSREGDGLDPAHETEGAGVTAARGAPVPAGDHDPRLYVGSAVTDETAPEGPPPGVPVR